MMAHLPTEARNRLLVAMAVLLTLALCAGVLLQEAFR